MIPEMMSHVGYPVHIEHFWSAFLSNLNNLVWLMMDL